MIYVWRLAHFKSIKDKMTQLNFGDLTIFAGANSSGKSSIIQSMLLLMQTIANRENTALHLNGELVTLGHVDDVWHNGDLPGDNKQKLLELETILRIDEETQLYLYLQFEPLTDTLVQLIRAEYAIGNEDDGYEQALVIEWDGTKHRITELSEVLELAMIDELKGEGLQNVDTLIGAPVSIFDYYPQKVLVEFETISGGLDWSTVIMNPLSEELRDEQLSLEMFDEHITLLERGIRQLSLPNFDARNRRRRTRIRHYAEWYGNLTTVQKQQLQTFFSDNADDLNRPVEGWYATEFFETVENTIFNIFTRCIKYLSAFRVSPMAIYAPNLEPYWSEVSVDGRSVAAALREHGKRQILYWDPNETQLKEDSLLQAVYAWLRFLDLLDRIEAEDQGKLGTLIRVYAQGTEKELDLTAVGFGTSQILPILVQGLLTRPNNLFIVEQPEVHLHPRVQSQLAYFFFALTRAGIQCIVETHSEYIVNHLRLLIARGDHRLHQQVKMYFATRDGENGTQFEEVRISSSGKITNWPRGFMDESTELAEEMLKAATGSL